MGHTIVGAQDAWVLQPSFYTGKHIYNIKYVYTSTYNIDVQYIQSIQEDPRKINSCDRLTGFNKLEAFQKHTTHTGHHRTASVIGRMAPAKVSICTRV